MVGLLGVEVVLLALDGRDDEEELVDLAGAAAAAGGEAHRSPSLPDDSDGLASSLPPLPSLLNQLKLEIPLLGRCDGAKRKGSSSFTRGSGAATEPMDKVVLCPCFLEMAPDCSDETWISASMSRVSMESLLLPPEVMGAVAPLAGLCRPAMAALTDSSLEAREILLNNQPRRVP